MSFKEDCNGKITNSHILEKHYLINYFLLKRIYAFLQTLLSRKYAFISHVGEVTLGSSVLLKDCGNPRLTEV